MFSEDTLQAKSSITLDHVPINPQYSTTLSLTFHLTSADIMATSSVQSNGQYLTKAKCISLKSCPVAQPQGDEVQIEVRSVTVCGSDLHYFSHGCNGAIVPRQPLCLGHESSGQIVAVGEGVRNVKAGDRVAIEPGVPCSRCTICDEGRYNLCPSLRFRGSGAAFPHYQGLLQERVNHPSKWVHMYVYILNLSETILTLS